MNRTEFVTHAEALFEQLMETSRVAAKEYARAEDDNSNVFDNFIRHGKNLGLDAKVIWGVYFNKHIDAINAYIKHDGKNEQREDIRGRMLDAIVYLFLIHAMVTEGKGEKKPNKLNSVLARENHGIKSPDDFPTLPPYMFKATYNEGKK